MDGIVKKGDNHMECGMNSVPNFIVKFISKNNTIATWEITTAFETDHRFSDVKGSSCLHIRTELIDTEWIKFLLNNTYDKIQVTIKQVVRDTTDFEDHQFIVTQEYQHCTLTYATNESTKHPSRFDCLFFND